MSAGRRVVFVYAGGREARWPDRANRPSEFFYGAVEMEREGWDVRICDFPDVGRSPVAALARIFLGHSLPVKVGGEHLVAAARVLKKLRGADVVVATASHIALALGTLAVRLPPVVAIHCGIANFPPQPRKRSATARVLRAQQNVFFSAHEADATADLFAVDRSCITPAAFGVDVNFWTPEGAVPRERFVLAIGNDARRDYATLARAARNLPVPVRIITQRDVPDAPANVEIIRGSLMRPAVTDPELRELYRRAAVVVVPVVDSPQPSGQSVALQAMACGAPVVMTRTSGLWTGEDFLDPDHLRLVPCDDPQALAETITAALDNPEAAAEMGSSAQERVRLRGSVDAFAASIVSACS